MNQIAITTPDKAISRIGWTDEAVLDRMLTCLRTAAGSVLAAFQAPPQYRSFIEENLLDPRLGPEISRTLR